MRWRTRAKVGRTAFRRNAEMATDNTLWVKLCKITSFLLSSYFFQWCSQGFTAFSYGFPWFSYGFPWCSYGFPEGFPHLFVSPGQVLPFTESQPALRAFAVGDVLRRRQLSDFSWEHII